MPSPNPGSSSADGTAVTRRGRPHPSDLLFRQYYVEQTPRPPAPERPVEMAGHRAHLPDSFYSRPDGRKPPTNCPEWVWWVRWGPSLQAGSGAMRNSSSMEAARMPRGSHLPFPPLDQTAVCLAGSGWLQQSDQKQSGRVSSAVCCTASCSKGLHVMILPACSNPKAAHFLFPCFLCYQHLPLVQRRPGPLAASTHLPDSRSRPVPSNRRCGCASGW